MTLLLRHFALKKEFSENIQGCMTVFSVPQNVSDRSSNTCDSSHPNTMEKSFDS
jgi:hypothetical protein